MMKFVEIDGYKNSVYYYGKGDFTLVLLSGSGVPFPNLEYMNLVRELGKTYQVIGIEKLGYGYSDLSNKDRKINDIVCEYRGILQKLKIKTPVILLAHSMGFLEAIYWGQQYPQEISAIIGIDPATPECYRDFNIEEATNKLIEMSNNELLRKAVSNALIEQLIKENYISQTDKKEFENLAYNNLANKNWISEAKNLRDAISLVEKNNPYLQIPMLFFISNGEGTTLEKENWINHSLQYLSNIEISEYELFDLPHNLYKFVYKEMAQTTIKFISKYI